MNKNKIKIEFFQQEIEALFEFKESLEEITVFIRQVLHSTDPKNQFNALQVINRELQAEVIEIQHEIDEIKKDSDLTYDEAKVEEKAIFWAEEEKIEDLNQRLFIAETKVQEAELLNKELLALGNDEKRPYFKSWKKKIEEKICENYVTAHQKVINEFKRSIYLMMRMKEQSSKERENELVKLIQAKQKGIPYRMIKSNKVEDKKRYKSEEKEAIVDNNLGFGNKKKRKSCHENPLIVHLLTSPFLAQKREREIALKNLIQTTKESNKKISISNKKLENAIELRHRSQVLEYLENKSDLNEEESVMKLELMASKLQAHIEERLLSFKTGKESKDFSEGETQQSYFGIENRRTKSLNKNECQKEGKQIQYEKQSASNPKTNDSLTWNLHYV